jgi:hypothetical protein
MIPNAGLLMAEVGLHGLGGIGDPQSAGGDLADPEASIKVVAGPALVIVC